MHKGLFGKKISVSVELHIFAIPIGFSYSYRRLICHINVIAQIWHELCHTPLVFASRVTCHPVFLESMVRLRLWPRSSRDTEQNDGTHRRHRAIIATTIAIVTATIAVIDASWNCLNPEPYHMSALSGHAWVQELLDGYRNHMKDNLAL